MPETLKDPQLPLKLLRSGKVREVYEVDADTLLIVASDRVSAFDVVLPNPIPRKGAVLTQISTYWFQELSAILPSHFLTADDDIAYPPDYVAATLLSACGALIGNARWARVSTMTAG